MRIVPIDGMSQLTDLFQGIQIEFFGSFHSYCEDKDEEKLNLCLSWAENMKAFLQRPLEETNQSAYFEQFVTESFDFIRLIELLELRSNVD